MRGDLLTRDKTLNSIFNIMKSGKYIINQVQTVLNVSTRMRFYIK